MSIKNLDVFFNPRRIAVIGASEDLDSLGYTIFKNLVGKGFKGTVYPVHHKLEAVQGVEAYQKITVIPKDIDLAIVATAPDEIPTALDECGQKDVKGVIILCPDFRHRVKDSESLANQIRQITLTYGLRVLGPNSIGYVRPGRRLNSSLFPEMPPKGNIAFISHSATIASALLDRAVSKNVGLSCFVSLGERLDIDTTDLVDFLAMDPETKAIILFVEAINKGRKFMTAVRSFASSKPIVVVKAGKYGRSTQVTVTRLASLAEEDRVYDAAFKRAGLVRVDEILDLFYLSETLSKQLRPKGKRLAIISNAGGPALLAMDTLLKRDGELAELAQGTIGKIKEQVPSSKEFQNPVDLLSDAKPEHYSIAVKNCLNDEGVDGVLVIYAPSFGTKSKETAEAIISAAKAYPYKPIFTSWMGEEQVLDAREILNDRGIPTFVTPEQAVKSFVYMYRYDYNLRLLSETPEAIIGDFTPDKSRVLEIIGRASREGRTVLRVNEAKGILEEYGIPVIATGKATSEEEAAGVSDGMGYPVVLKLQSEGIANREERRGVIFNLKNRDSVKDAFVRIKNIALSLGESEAEVSIQPMVLKRGYNLVIGAKKDATFGAVIVFGTGGEILEALEDYSIALPPLNQALVRNMMSETKIYKFLQGQEVYKNTLKNLEVLLVRFSQLIVDFPHFKEIDINPFFVTGKEGFAMDATIVLDEGVLEGAGALEKDLCPDHLSICPYPTKYIKEFVLNDGTVAIVRPIRPEDEPAVYAMMKTLSERSMSERFIQQIVDMPHERLVRYCQVDYDREMAFVATVKSNGTEGEIIIGDVRFIKGSDPENAEVAVLVSDQWQGRGVAKMLMWYCIMAAKETGVKALWMEILKGNFRMHNLAKRFGFKQAYADEDMIRVVLEIH